MSELSWRLLSDGQSPGAWNMAVDEALLEGVAAGSSPATLRFYGWGPACLSLGYFQPFSVVDSAACRAMGIDIVRRPTGGRAILHDRELTYSVTLPAAVLGHDSGILPSYQRISGALQVGLRAVGVTTERAPVSAAPTSAEKGAICFDRPSAYEILAEGRKLVGSAQTRRGSAILQHGSILIEPRLERLIACLRRPDAIDRQGLLNSVIGLAELGVTTTERLISEIAAAFATEFGVCLEAGVLNRNERAVAASIRKVKYEFANWTQRPQSAAVNTTRTR